MPLPFACMTPLDFREQRITLWVALAGAVASITIWAPAFDKSAAVILALIGVALSGLLALTARSRRRLLTCLAAVLLGFGPWGVAWVLGLPYIALATWLLFRDRKAVAAARRSGDTETPERPVERAKRERGPRSKPGASKRYTPPQGRS